MKLVVSFVVLFELRFRSDTPRRRRSRALALFIDDYVDERQLYMLLVRIKSKLQLLLGLYGRYRDFCCCCCREREIVRQLKEKMSRLLLL